MYAMKLFSAMEEAVRFLNSYEKTSKLASFVNKSNLKLGTKLYEPKTIVSAINNFTILKVLQTLQLHENFTLHSVSTLMKITSSVAHKATLH